MSFITQLVKKLAEKGEPENWGIAKQEDGDPILVVVTFHLNADELAMLHVIDEDGNLPRDGGQ